MSIDFRFTDIDSKNLDAVMKFIAPQDLDYPNWELWQEKARSELSSGEKYGYALYYYGSVAGDGIFQRHKQMEELIEWKNIRIHPKLRERKCASFMIKQVEFEMPYEAIIVDARTTQTDMINLLLSLGYFPIAKKHLYDLQHQDIIFLKPKDKENKDRIIHTVKSTLNLY